MKIPIFRFTMKLNSVKSGMMRLQKLMYTIFNVGHHWAFDILFIKERENHFQFGLRYFSLMHVCIKLATASDDDSRI